MIKTVFNCILKLIFVSFVSIGNSVSGTNYCFIVGKFQASTTGYVYSRSDLPDRCSVIVYGNYIFDNPAPMYNDDECAIKDLVAAQRPVYLVIGYLHESGWAELLTSDDQDIYLQRKSAFVKALKDLSISGVLIDLEFDTLCAFTVNITNFISDIKIEIPALKMGVSVSGGSLYYEQIAPDFSIINNKVDFYVAKLFADDYVFNYKCGNVTVPDANDTLTLELLIGKFTLSGIEMKKTVGAWDVGVTRSDGVATVSHYCTNHTVGWCTENSKTLYNDGVCIKKYFSSIWIRYLDFDDYKGTCECQKFPATNTILDGYVNTKLVECLKIN